MFFEEDLDSDGIVVRVEEGHGFADELDRDFEEAAANSASSGRGTGPASRFSQRWRALGRT